MNYRDWNGKEANPYGWVKNEIKACYGFQQMEWGNLNGYSTGGY